MVLPFIWYCSPGAVGRSPVALARTPTVRYAVPPGPGPLPVKNLKIFPNDGVLHFFTDERTSEIGRDRRSRPCYVRPAAEARAAGEGADPGRPRREGRPDPVGALADRERQ